MGANGGSTRVPVAEKKIIVSKNVPRPLGMLKQVFLVRFERVVTHFGPWKLPKCLENGGFWDQKWVKMGQKAAFPKAILDRSGCSKQVFFGLLEHMVTRFWTIENPKCLENGLFGDQKWVKIGSKLHFSKSDCGPFGMPEQIF